MSDTNKFGQDAITALEQVLNLKLPENCEVEVQIRDFKADPAGDSQVIKVELRREAGQATRFDVKRLVGAMSEAHRT